ncbi:zinc-dependent metalloprotease [Naumannella cuiyingiana]|uniref:Coenzyme F420 biosynthesis associated uncharacterized protein n=1 Tax=Naumannella cuiyingiana TaxID=1347891 RepID=A0A7Z0D9G1_9ACTN|nr:zinc-dependent metalloprotease [Naumannella cuiyingiana]NYI71425.1 coenzyme F420 biosynthesis associated uncharacterized protein [Naumannella cuiyingiana]
MDIAGAIDYDAALATALRLVPPGPALGAAEARAVVAELRDAAGRAGAHVGETTGLRVPAGDPPVVVIDRPGWLRANLATLRGLLGEGDGEPGGLVAKLSAVEVGAMLAWLSTRVLGQFDPFGSPRRLMLIAPNVVHVERRLEVDPADFRLWVCLHEETHRVQFAHAPWLADHLRGLLRSFLDGIDVDASMIAMIMERVRRGAGATGSLLDLVTDERQQRQLDQIIAVMSLVEGHADVIMDEVGPAVVPSVATIRRRFDARRSAGGWSGLARRLLGMEAKMRQYAEGAAFCRAVLAEVGMAGLNHVWTSPNTLPGAAEIADPKLWLDRMRHLPRA